MVVVVVVVVVGTGVVVVVVVGVIVVVAVGLSLGASRFIGIGINFLPWILKSVATLSIKKNVRKKFVKKIFQRAYEVRTKFVRSL